MIVVRNIFRLKFGKTREAVAAWKEGIVLGQSAGGLGRSPRLLTDLVGPSYMLVLEATYDSSSDFERSGQAIFANEAWHKWYQTIVPLMESARREIFTIVQ